MRSIKLALLNIKKNIKNEKELKSSFIISVVGMMINNILVNFCYIKILLFFKKLIN